MARLTRLGVAGTLRYTPGKVDWAAAALPVEGEQAARPRAIDALRDDVPRCRPDERAREVQDRIRRAGWDLAVVAGGDGIVLGLVRGATLERRSDAVVEAVMEAAPTTARPSLALEDAAGRFSQGGDSLLVTTPDGLLLGALKRADVERRLRESTSAARSG